MSPSRWRVAADGLAAGSLASLAMVVSVVAVRLVFGIPLIAELASDRIIPSLPVRRFLRLSAALGGLERGKEVALIGGFGLTVLIGSLAGVIAAILLERFGGRRRRTGLVLASILAAAAAVVVVVLWPVLASNYRGIPPAPALVLDIAGIAASFGLYGLVFSLVYRRLDGWSREGGAGGVPAPERRRGAVVGRRALLIAGGGLGLAVASAGLVNLLYRRATVGPNGYDGLLVRGPHTAPITPNERFYVVTKNLIDPVVDASLWRLDVTGLVERPHTYGFAELAGLPSRTQIQTLECISNGVGGGLMSTARWTGVPLSDVLDRARPAPDARFVVMHASDGYTHAMTLDRAMDPASMLAYGMNGTPLPQRHGYPVRVLVPGTYGEVNVKWVDRIDVTDRAFRGYYERQGWRPGVVNTTSRFDRPSNGASVRIADAAGMSVGGVAFAGDRGISRVQVSFDGGDTWTDARVDRSLGPLAWALWSAAWSPPGPGTYRLVVRATDGTGALQTATPKGVVPSGATGYHTVSVRVTA